MTTAPIVHTIDMKRVDKLIKECDPYLRNYIRALKEASEGWERLTKLAVAKLRQTNNSAMVPCRGHKVGEICWLSGFDGNCGDKPCNLARYQ
jgi:hypothetical protein